LLAIEVGTSRRVPAEQRVRDHEIDSATGRWFDLSAVASMAGTAAASIGWTDMTIQPRSASWAVGVVTMAAAIGVSTSARAHLGRFHRHALTSHSNHELVSTGPYRFVRHPIYSATILAFVGIGLTLGNWLGLALMAVLPTAALVHRIRVEEPILHERLGDTYAEFCTGRARLVPGVW